MENCEYTYRHEVLVEIAQICLEAENDLQQFINKHTVRYSPLHSSIILESREEERDYWIKDMRSFMAWESLHIACLLVGADAQIVLVTAKSMNRYMKHRKVYVRLPSNNNWSSSESGAAHVRRFFSDPGSDF